MTASSMNGNENIGKIATSWRFGVGITELYRCEMSGGEREYEGSEYERDDYEAARMHAEMDDIIEDEWAKVIDRKVHPTNVAYIKDHEVMAKWFFKMGYIAGKATQ